jgi:hypothetical protein
MTEAIIDPSAASCCPACYCLFSEAGIDDYQQVDPDLFLFRAPARGGGLARADEVIE